MARLRISGGNFNGLALTVPRNIRPTSAKVRQALGNILSDVLPNARVMDGFAGSGAFGMEALSRGARFVAFIDSDTDAVLAIRDNLGRVDDQLPREAFRILHQDVSRALATLAKGELPFDIVFLDPPYQSPDGKKALISVGEYAMLSPTGIAVVEHDYRAELPRCVGSLRQWKQHRYGETVLSFYQ